MQFGDVSFSSLLQAIYSFGLYMLLYKWSDIAESGTSPSDGCAAAELITYVVGQRTTG